MVGTRSLVEGLPQVARLARGFGFAGLLGVVAGPGQIPVEQPGQHPVRQDGRPGTRADQVLPATGMISCPHDPARRHLGLVDRRNGLRMPGQLGPDPGELRGVDGRHLHHGDAHAGALVQQLTAQRGGEPVDGVLGPAIGGLQRDAALAERRPDLDDHAAIPRPHPGQRSHRAVHEPQVAHLGDPPELFGGDLGEWREHRGERHVHPYVDRPEGLLDLPGGRVHLAGIGHVGRDRVGDPAGCGHVLGRPAQAFFATGDEPDLCAARTKQPGRRAPDPRASPGDDNRLNHRRPATRGRLGETAER